ncbi:MAG: TetR/AcrR family transcriptional regulator [Acidimicrobiales bacterium]
MAGPPVSDGAPTGVGATSPARRGRAPRLRRADRREALLDAAIVIALDHGVEAVSMETVAARARVSRPLLYKHFANASELLAAAYRREMSILDADVAAAIDQATGLEGAVRALVRAVIEETEARGALLTRLIRAGARDTQNRQDQRAREARTVRHFGRLAEEELGIGHREAMSVARVLLTGIDSIIHQWHERPSSDQRVFLEELYVAVFLGGLRAVAARSTAAATRP